MPATGKGSFVANLDHLIAETPTEISGQVEVDQVYAHYQHAHPEFHHPDGGQAFYLSDPLYLKHEEYLRALAEGANTGHLRDAMIGVVEDLSQEVYDRAPWEFADLRASGHPTVSENGRVVYDRAPLCKRLDPEELAIKSHLRYLFDPHRYDYDRRH
jgi:hypothetical protein